MLIRGAYDRCDSLNLPVQSEQTKPRNHAILARTITLGGATRVQTEPYNSTVYTRP